MQNFQMIHKLELFINGESFSLVATHVTGFGKTLHVRRKIEAYFINSHTQALSRHSDKMAID